MFFLDALSCKSPLSPTTYTALGTEGYGSVRQEVVSGAPKNGVRARGATLYQTAK